MGDGSATQHVGILYDPKLSGEPNHRPALRYATVRDATYSTIMMCVLDRHGVESSPIAEGDVYFLLDGRKCVAHNDLLNVFAGKDNAVKGFLVHKENESVMARYSRVQGVGTFKLLEHLILIRAS